MPRIRTLKPEHKSHRKVGRLSHIAYRLWTGMVTEADDKGRLVADAGQLRLLVFGYHLNVTIEDVEAALQEIAKTGLVSVYTVGGTRYVWFQSWTDHQRIDKPKPSKLPAPPVHDGSPKRHRKVSDVSVTSLAGSEGIKKGSRKGSEGKEGERGRKPTPPPSPPPGGALSLSGNGGKQPPARGTYDQILAGLRELHPDRPVRELEVEALHELVKGTKT